MRTRTRASSAVAISEVEVVGWVEWLWPCRYSKVFLLYCQCKLSHLLWFLDVIGVYNNVQHSV